MSRVPCLAMVIPWFLMGACGEGEGTGPGDASEPEAAAQPVDLLARAAANMRDGVLEEADREAILHSRDPAHARARRVLEALAAEPTPAVAENAEPEAGPDAADPGVDLHIPETPATDPVKTSAAREAPAPRRPAASKRGAVVTGLNFRNTSQGDVVLRLRASGGVSVGLANQRRSGIVRLVVDSAGASPAVLGARPRSRGASVTAVTRATESLFITLTLDPGWRVISLRRVPGGAAVTLRQD